MSHQPPHLAALPAAGWACDASCILQTRRLEALSKQKSRQPAAQQQQAAAAPLVGPSAAAAAAAAEGPPQFPYIALSHAGTPHIASRLQLAAPTACKGNLEDVLEGLMRPHMPVPVAQSTIASRVAADKAVTLINPTGRVNLAKPSASRRGQRQLLACKLLPRAQRAQLGALPKSGIDYSAMLALHDLWCRYTGGVLASAAPEAVQRLLNSLDWHGALVRVVGSSNPMYVHRVGVVAKATHSTFVLVSDDGRSSTVPLRGSNFECTMECGGRIMHVALSGDTLKTLKCAEKVDTDGG